MDHSTIDDAGKVDSDVKYMPLEDVERLECYRPGGYHPVAIGDHLHNRYRIVHKLGFGTYSTTWLARNQIAGSYVAIKIGIARTEPKDVEMLRLVRDLHLAYAATPGKAIIPPVLDEFNLKGPNGTHSCLVTVPARMSLADAKDASVSRLFQPSVARAIVAQLVQAIASLHSVGIVHADLHLGNVLLRLPESIDCLTPDQFYEKYNYPRLEPVERLDNQPLQKGVPSHGIMPAWLGIASDHVRLSDASILLADFGESFMPSATPRYYSNTPDLLVPPELYFLPHEPLSFPADIWALACTIWSILGQRPIFEAYNPSIDWMIKEHVDVLGKLPPEWWEQWNARSNWFDESGARKSDATRKQWAEWFQFCIQEPRREFQMEEVGEQERAALLTLLRSMLAFRPCERPNAEQVLQSEWMRRWALPELVRMGNREQ